jgi:tRNA G18 (ribose-2'-O)-methylase SpoU
VLAHIPMSGTVESLNLAVSTGICLAETRRRLPVD